MPGGGPNTRSGADRRRGVGEPSSGTSWHPAPVAGRGKTHASGAGHGVALPSGGARRGGREPGKSDPDRTPDRVDGYHGVRALGSLKTKPDAGSPAARPEPPPTSSARGRVCWPLDGPCREVTLLSDYRRDLVKQRKRVVNRLRWHLHELDPTLQIPPRGLRRYCVIDPLTERRDAREGVVARLARQPLRDCRDLR